MWLPGDDVAPRWQVATHLSAAREAEKYVNASRRSVARMRNSFFFALQYPFARSKGSLGGIHARTSLRALHHVCREHKKDPHTPHKKSEDLVTNMMSLNMITNRPEEAATPSGAVNRGARRKQVTADSLHFLSDAWALKA